MRFEDVEAAPVVSDRLAHLVAAYGRAPVGGMAVELGVFRGASINALAAADPERVFLGFDSFRGLPEPWDMGGSRPHPVPVGHFALDRPPAVAPNVVLVVGSFAASLPQIFGPIEQACVDFVHVDCDLYRSTVVALEWIGPILRSGSVVVFDELGNWDGGYPNWREGEWKALNEWVERSGRSVRPISRTDKQQAAFLVEN